MISQTVTVILLSIPLIALVISSIRYWSEFKKSKRSRKLGKKPKYKRFFYYSLVAGVLFMWVFWIGGIISLFLDDFYSVFGFMTFSTNYEMSMQVVGFFIFYIGAITYNLTIIYAGKYLPPSTSALFENHKLITKGPFGIIRHPLYVSYILILTGLGLILLTHWLLIPTLFVIIGIYPTAKAEEEILTDQFGEEYVEYKRKVGMLFPKLFSRIR